MGHIEATFIDSVLLCPGVKNKSRMHVLEVEVLSVLFSIESVLYLTVRSTCPALQKMSLLPDLMTGYFVTIPP